VVVIQPVTPLIAEELPPLLIRFMKGCSEE
jgi:hypothetical protein